MTDDELLAVLGEAADAVAAALAATTDWGDAGTVPGQHLSDLVADRAALEVLHGAGLGVLSEESERSGPSGGIVVVVDPLDGSTNASRGISWWATSLCAVDDDGPVAAVVDDHVAGTRAVALRGGGAQVDDRPARTSGRSALDEAIVGLNGLPGRHLGWAQCRALGAAALDLCAVATGRLDAFLDCSLDGLAPWDYLGAALVCREAGATIRSLDGRSLDDLDPPDRRGVVAAASPALADELAERFERAGRLPSL